MTARITLWILLAVFLNAALVVDDRETTVSSREVLTLAVDEMNSVAEFILQYVLNYPDDTPEDEDDDIPDGCQYYAVALPEHGICTPQNQVLALTGSGCRSFGEKFREITSPPPQFV